MKRRNGEWLIRTRQAVNRRAAQLVRNLPKRDRPTAHEQAVRQLWRMLNSGEIDSFEALAEADPR